MNTKDAFYFPHDSNAKDDPKIVLLVEQMGLEGYGAFWVLVEILRDQPEFKYPIALIPAIARRYNITTEKMKAVVTKYGLFQVEDEEFFFSPSLNNRMLPLLEKKEQARLAAHTRWEKQRQLTETNNSNADAMRTHSDSNAHPMPKREEEKREDKSREGKKFTPPSIDQVKEYCKERENNVDAERFINFYESKGWMVGKNKMKDWKAAVRNWESSDKQQTKLSTSLKI